MVISTPKVLFRMLNKIANTSRLRLTPRKNNCNLHANIGGQKSHALSFTLKISNKQGSKLAKKNSRKNFWPPIIDRIFENTKQFEGLCLLYRTKAVLEWVVMMEKDKPPSLFKISHFKDAGNNKKYNHSESHVKIGKLILMNNSVTKKVLKKF